MRREDRSKGMRRIYVECLEACAERTQVKHYSQMFQHDNLLRKVGHGKIVFMWAYINIVDASDPILQYSIRTRNKKTTFHQTCV